jgi:hypothetical protein
MRQQHFHVRSWDGRVYAYLYLGPLRLTIFSSAWLFGKRKKRTVSGWVLHYLGRAVIMGALFGLPAWATYHHPYWSLDLLTSIARRAH